MRSTRAFLGILDEMTPTARACVRRHTNKHTPSTGPLSINSTHLYTRGRLEIPTRANVTPVMFSNFFPNKAKVELNFHVVLRSIHKDYKGHSCHIVTHIHKSSWSLRRR